MAQRRPYGASKSPGYTSSSATRPRDAVLAQAINAELKTAFSQAIIRTTLDSEIKLGVDWRTWLEEALSDADVLLIVATGRQKLSHSYTGFEVGFFSASKRDREKMRHFGSERLIIPIGILEKISEALSDIESLNLNGTLTPFLVDEDTLKNKQRFPASVETDAAKNPLMKLFMRLKEVVGTLHPFDDDLTEDFKRRARESANRLCLTFFDEFQKRVFIENSGERKSSCAFDQCPHRGDGGSAAGHHASNSSAEASRCSGSTRHRTGPSPGPTSSSRFTNDTIHGVDRHHQVAHHHGEAGRLRREQAAHRVVRPQRFFRLFVARSVVYYSNYRAPLSGSWRSSPATTAIRLPRCCSRRSRSG